MIIDNDEAFSLALRNGKLSLQFKDNIDLKLYQRGPIISLDISQIAPIPHLDDEECTQTSCFRSFDRQPRSEPYICSDLIDKVGIKKSTVKNFQDELGHQLFTESFDDENEHSSTSSSAPSSEAKEKFDAIDRPIEDLFTLICTCTLWKMLQLYIQMCHCYSHSRWAVVQEENGFETLHCFDGDVPDTDDYFMQKPQMQRAIRYGQKGEVSVKAFGNMYSKGILAKIAKPPLTFKKEFKELPIKADNEVANQNCRVITKIEEDMIGSISDASVLQIAGVNQRSRRPSAQQLYRETREKSCLNIHTFGDIIAPKSMLVRPYNLVEGEKHVHEWDGQCEVTDVTMGFKEWSSATDTANYMKMYSFKYKASIEYTSDQAVSLTDDLQKTSITNQGKEQALGNQAPVLPDFAKESISSLPAKVDNACSPNQVLSKTVENTESDIRLTNKADILKRKSMTAGHDFEKREGGNVTEKSTQQRIRSTTTKLRRHSERNGIESTPNGLQCRNINSKEATRQRDTAYHRSTVTKNARPHKKKSPSTLRLYTERPHNRQTKEDKGNWMSPKERRILVDDHISTGSVETSLLLSSEGKDVEAPRQSEVDTSCVCASRMESKNGERNTLLHIEESFPQTTNLPVSDLIISKIESDPTTGCKVSSCPSLSPSTSVTATYQYTRIILQAGERKHPHSSGDTMEIKRGHRSCVEKEFNTTSYNTDERIYHSRNDDFLALDPGGRWGSHSSEKQDDANCNGCAKPETEKGKDEKLLVSSTVAPYHKNNADKTAATFPAARIKEPSASVTGAGIPSASVIQKSNLSAPPVPPTSPNKVGIPPASANEGCLDLATANEVGIPASADKVGLPPASASKAGIPSTSANKVGIPQAYANNVGMPSATGIGIPSGPFDGQLQIHCSGCLERQPNTNHTIDSGKTSRSPKRNNAITEANVASVDLESKGDCSHGGRQNPNKKTENIQKFYNESKAEEKGNAFSGEVKSCSCCVGEILKHAGCSMEVIKVKEHIIHEMCIRPGRLPLKTVYGLAVWCLRQMDQWEIDKLTGYPWAPLETHVHNVLNELKHQGLKLGHVVKYFSREDSKRLDILQLIAEIHPDCSYCSTQITDFR